MAYWLMVILIAVQLGIAEAESFDRFLTVRSIFESLNYSVRSLLLCTPTHDHPNGTHIVRAVDTGQGISLPNKTKLVHHVAPYHMLTAYLMPNLDDPIDTRFGAYTCEVTVDNVTTRVTTFKLPSTTDDTAEVSAPQRYLRANHGDRVELKVEAGHQPLTLRWKLNGHDHPEWENLTQIVIDAATSNDSGIYECFYDGHQELGLHALMQLTVRECPPNKWGESCSYDCPICYNGGICNARLGVCICSPGFDGDNCEIACDPNYFGEDCEKQCDSDDTAAPEDACAAFMFCLPDPYGCTCGPGFHGQFCLDDCDDGFYGAGCSQPCHCKEGHAACNPITGYCDEGCAYGWAGESCQIAISNPIEYYNVSGIAFECPLGYFGFPYCNESCHCSSKNACDSTTGICPSGCADGWNGTTCSECVMGKFGPKCDGICHCDLGVTACNGTTGACDGGCGPGYVGFSCQQECPQSRYGSNCSSTCFCQNGGRCNNGTCECLSKWRGDSCDESAPEILGAEDLMGNVGTTVNVTCLVWSKPPADIQIWSPDFPGLATEVVQINNSMQVAWTLLELNNVLSATFNCSVFNNHGRTDTAVQVTSFECPQNTFGSNCSSTCFCLNGGRCNTFNGTCECVSNWLGDACDESVPEILGAEDRLGNVGTTVNVTCLVWSKPPADIQIWSSDFPGLATEVVQINNSMQVAWTLLELNNVLSATFNCSVFNNHGRTDTAVQVTSFECPQNTFGSNCSSTCLCLNGGRCNPFNGTCECVSKWLGDACDESVPEILAAEDLDGYVGETVNITCLVWSQPPAEVQIATDHFQGLTAEMVQVNESIQVAWTELELLEASSLTFNCSAFNNHGTAVSELTVNAFELPVLTSAPTVVSRSSNALELQWDAWKFGKDKGGRMGDVVEYQVMVRFDGHDVWYEVSTWITPTAMRVTRLTPGTTYEFAVRCRLSGRKSPGEPGPYTTVETECQPNQANVTWPQDFQTEEVATNHVRLQWKEPTENDLGCPLQKYLLRYWPKDKPASQGLTVELPDDQDHYMLEGLQSGTEYVVELSAVAKDVVVGRPARISVTPHISMTGPVEGLQTEPVSSSTEAHVSWYEPVLQRAAITKYKVKYQLVDRGKCGHKHSDAVNETEVTKKEVVLTGLFPFSVYDVSVQPLTALGTGEMAFISATTNEGVPATGPHNVRGIVTTPSSLGFCWEAMLCEEVNGVIANYEYRLTKVNHSKTGKVKRAASVSFQTQLISANQTEAIIQNLESSEAYEFAVRGLTAAGAGPWSDVVYESTLEDVPSSPSLVVWKVTSTEGFVEIHRPPLTRSKIKAYQLKWTTNDGDAKSYHTSVIADPPAINYTLGGLKPGTCYNLTVISHSEAGWSNQSASVVLCTENELPGPPTELELTFASARSLKVKWRPPHPPRDSFIGYKVKYQLLAALDGVTSLSGRTALKEIPLVNNRTTKAVISELEPLSEYEVTIVTFNQYGESQPLKKIFTTLAYSAASARLPPPPPPKVYSMKVAAHTVPVRMFPVDVDPDSVRSYQLVVEDVGLNNDLVHADFLNNYYVAKTKNFWFYIAAEIPASDVSDNGYLFVVGNNKSYEGYYNAPLEPSHHYQFHVRSMGHDQKAYSSLTVSAELVQTLNSTVDGLPTRVDEQVGHDECMRLGLSCVWFLVIIIVLTLVVILFLILLLCTRWRKHSHGSHKIRQPSSKVWVDNDEEKPRSERKRCVSSSRTYSVSYSVSEAQVNAESGPIVCGGQTGFATKLNGDGKGVRTSQWGARTSVQGAIPVSKLGDYIQFKFSHPTSNFQEEFKQILNGQTGMWLEAKKSENLEKNRYGNILPYDHTRVCLQPLPHILHSDYINASFIDGYRKKRAYIAAQGPKENYFSDFWRMVWQENVAAIVMVTGLVEVGRVKCDQYWPNDGCIYGDLHVTLMETQTAVNIITRSFLMQKISTGDTRRIKHYQILDWPDQSIPMYASPMLNLRNRLLQETAPNAGPLIVHCSAGIGRTGTFIAVDALLRQAKEEGAVDVFSYVNKIRLQRISMVQSLEQYIFIYETILEALESRDTKVMASHLPTYYKEIIAGAQSSVLQQQFTKLEDSRVPLDWHQCSDALNETNLNKNRDLAVLPSNTKRVRLSTLYRCCSSDYINAVFCDGYKLRRLFLSTQVPLPNTIEDFWTMVSNYQSSVIIVLHGTGVKSGLTNCAEYWPTDGCCHYGRYQVQVVTFQRRDFYVEQNLKLIDDDAAANAEPQRIVQLQFTGEWVDDDDVPTSPAAMAALLRQAATWHRRLGGPITVLCMDGASRCGLFCVGSVLGEQLRVEGAADVFQVVRRMQKHRPAMITSPAQFQFCYQLALELMA